MGFQQSLFEKVCFSSSEKVVQKEIVISNEVVTSTVAHEKGDFNDIRAWWKAYLSQKQQAEVNPWSGKGKEIFVAELFSGPGGLAQGVRTFCDDIGVKFQSIAALDMDRDALRVYERNHKTHYRASENDNDWGGHNGDVTKLVSGEWNNPKITKRVINTHKEKEIKLTSNDDWKRVKTSHRALRTKWKRNQKLSRRPTLSVQEIEANYGIDPPQINPDGPWSNIKSGEIDLLLAGPPCQGHSNLNNHSRRDDYKNELYLVVPAVASAWKIPLVIIENVEGVIHDVSGVVQQTEGLFKSMGYKVEKGVLNAQKMGWPQTRKRYFLIARKGVSPISIEEVMKSFSIPRDQDPLGVFDAIADLTGKKTFTRKPRKKGGGEGKKVTSKNNNHMFTVPKYSKKEIARANYHASTTKKQKIKAVDELEKIFLEEGEIDPSVIKENFKRAREEIDIRSEKDLNEDWNLPTRLHNKTHWEATSYPTVYGKLDWDKPSGTITSGYMCSGRGRFTHPELPRTLTPIEAARLQGFPDSYDWKPEEDRIPRATDIAQWIGDAVPMPLGYAAAYSALGNGLDFN
tara:strand:- start:1529 stop:3241 length:1713 start_codon:yes stop_codon:yes gene_type:complete